ncbi:transcription factor TFIID complex subunit 8 C-term-domain-containing protein [Pyronema omphalodes]|nr:transcription factor TFIID complex subunit 8 C-term-domain-containing protein [Pyronema omphalodes]
MNSRPKKRRRVVAPEKDVNAAEVLPEEVVSQLLHRSTAKILQSYGFTGAAVPAQEHLLKLIENYYLQMLQTIGLFAIAQRRTKPTVLDFEEMLRQNHISLSGLEDEMQRMPSKATVDSLPPPSPPPLPEPDLSELLGAELDGSRDNRCQIYDHLPPFPSRHTYQETPVFSERPTDPRMIREKATAESRLAEQALRKLLAVSATKKDATKETDQRLGKKRKDRHERWNKAFEGLEKGRKDVNGYSDGGGLNGMRNELATTNPTKKQDEDGYLEVIVNADSQFWRKSKGTSKRA